MEKTKRRDWEVRVVHSHEEMDAVDDAFYENLTNQQRLDIMVELVARHQQGHLVGLTRLCQFVQFRRDSTCGEFESPSQKAIGRA